MVARTSGVSLGRQAVLAKAWLAGSVPTLLLIGWMLTGGRWDILQTTHNADFVFDGIFDAQAWALLEGRLDIPAEIATFEGLLRDGKTYVYYGIFPALLRIPILVSTDALDGRMATLSMILAYVVLAIGSARLSSALRFEIRGASRVSRKELLATAGLAIAVLSGPPLLLASGPYVYHEVTLWGLAWSIAAFDAILRWRNSGHTRSLVLVAVLLTLSLLSRQTVGLGPVVTFVLIAGSQQLRRWRRDGGWSVPLARAAVAVSLVAGIPVLLLTAFHVSRTGALLGADETDKVYLHSRFHHEPETIEHYKLGPQHLVRTIPFYLRPVGLELRRDFPWMDFPLAAKRLANRGVPNHAVEWSPSLPTVSPVLCGLSGVGLLWGVRTRPRRQFDYSLWPFAAGTIAAATTALFYWGVSARYLPDIYPVVLIGGIVGFHALADQSPRFSDALRRGMLIATGCAVAVGATVTAALTLTLQRQHWYYVPDEWRAEMIHWRLELPGAPTPTLVAADDPLPEQADDGDLLVAGTCGQRFVRWEHIWKPLSADRPNARSAVVPANASEAKECFQ